MVHTMFFHLKEIKNYKKVKMKGGARLYDKIIIGNDRE